MISEIKFSSNYSSFWNEITPLTESYLKRENLRLERHSPDVRSISPANLRGFTNELAFFSFTDIRNNNKIKFTPENVLKNNWIITAQYINRIPNSEKISLNIIDDKIIKESSEILKNLLNTFPATRKYICRPKFKGCGLINSCEGDYIENNCLYEIKSGDRNFRSNDIRQLLTYSALEYSSNEKRFERLGLFNPRTGLLWTENINKLLLEISGQSASEIFPLIRSEFENINITK